MRETKVIFTGIMILLLSIFCTSCRGIETSSKEELAYKYDTILSIRPIEANGDIIAEKAKQKIEEAKQKLEAERIKAEEAAKAIEVAKVQEAERQAQERQVQEKANEAINHSNNVTTNIQREELLVEQIQGIGSAEQVITVTNDNSSELQVTVQAFEKRSGKWVKILECPGVIGFEGFSYNKTEQNNTSPIGIYTIGTAFGQAGNPGTGLNFRDITPNDYWVDDPNSDYYNSWQTGAPAGRWNSAEDLYNISVYKYGFVINYNTSNVVKGKGSAIFFHIWSSSYRGTAGCTAVAEENVVKLLNWLSTDKNPLIVQGTVDQVRNM